MKRRDFVAALGGTAVTWPLAARAQQGQKVLRVGRVRHAPHGHRYPMYDAFDKRMRELGWVEGKSLVYVTMTVPNMSFDVLKHAYREVVRRKPDVIRDGATEPALKAALAAGAGALPMVVTALNYDPVARGYAKSYRAAGGNLTGIYVPQRQLLAKRLQLFAEAFPRLKALTVFRDAEFSHQWPWMQAAAANLQLELFDVVFDKRPFDIERGWASVPAKYRGAFILLQPSSGFTDLGPKAWLDFHRRHPVPDIVAGRQGVTHWGAFMAYGVDWTAFFARAADYVDRIGKGANTATLPIEAVSKFVFVINLKRAKALDIKLPRSTLLRATEVIE